MTAEVTASRRRATGRALLIVSALGAAGFAGWSLAQLQLATSETFLGEAWHAFGLIVFAGLFALVAWRPRAYPGLMELTIAHSIGMFVMAVLNQDSDGATATMILHGLLALALIIAYVVLGCIKAWGRQPGAQPSPTESPRTESTHPGSKRPGSKRAEVTREPTTRDPAAAKDSPAVGQQSRQPAASGAPRGIERTPEAPTQSAAPPRSAPSAEPRPQQAQPTKPMPQELPEDRPLG